ncbi:TRAP transporter substrate-binding protein DctP [Microbaculum marinum]|uniref:TRAP transporter substrate-binding protein DctP n=1 Tax=Microbaculum marinum TaxID=1764581 RepID=A0AAW9REE8_9HYPH
MLKRLSTLAVVGTIVGSVVAASAVATASAETKLRAAPGQPPSSPVVSVFYTNFGTYLEEESGGELGTALVGMEIVGLKEMKSALNSKLAEVGNVLPAFFPSDLSDFLMTGDLAMLASDAMTVSAAMTEYVVNCADCQAELKKFGIVYTGSVSTDPFVILTRKPVTELADLKGLRLRTPSPPYARFAEAAGAIAVNAPPTETFESISQGLLDGEIASVVDLTSYRLLEVVTDVTMIPLGLYYTTIPAAVAADVWKARSPEERKALIGASNRAGADMNQAWGYTSPDKAVAAGKDAGVTFHEPGASLTEFADSFVESDLQVAAKAATDNGIADVETKIATFRSLLEKWEGIIAETGTDPKAVADRMQTEIWDKVDLSTYGQ